MPGGSDVGLTGTPVPEEDGQADGTSADAQAEDEIGSAAEAVIRATDFSEWQQAAEEAGLEINAVQMIRALAGGELAASGETLGRVAYDLLLGEARSMSGWLALFIGPALLWALNRGFLSGGQLGSAAGFVCYLAGAGVMLGAFGGWMAEAQEAVGRLNRISGRIFPTLLALMNSAGSPGAAGVSQTLATFLSGQLTGFVGRAMTVLAGSAAVLAVAGNMTERTPLQGLQKLCCSAGNWLLGGVMTMFLGVASLGGLMGSSRDGLTVRAAKYAADNLLPVVGGDIADTMGAMAHGAALIKNAAGVTGMLLLAAVCIRPILRLAMGMLVCRLAAALTEPVADGPLRRCAAQMGEAAQVLLVGTAVCTALFMTLIGVVLSAGGNL